jgi:hypothetical protein
MPNFICGDKNMKRVLRILRRTTLLFSSWERAQDRDVDVGVMVSDSTGISAKPRTTSTTRSHPQLRDNYEISCWGQGWA